MRIVLMRHGEVDLNPSISLTATEFADWVKLYNQTGIIKGSTPPNSSISQAGECKFVVCSNLPRSIESAHSLGLHTIDVSTNLFAETILPELTLNFPKLTVKTWSGLLRMLWFLGFGKGTESSNKARQRAKLAADKLERYAKEHDSVIILGHGEMNYMIARALINKTWQQIKTTNHRHWSFRVLKKM